MTIRIRELRRGEAPAWRDLRLRALLESPDAFGSTYEIESQRSNREWEEHIEANLANPYVSNLIAEVDGQAAGISVCVFDEMDRSLCYLFAMWVDPEFRGRGVARALVASATDWMRLNGAKTAQLSVTKGNEAAFALYKSFGFADTGLREPLREGSELELIVMHYQLAPLAHSDIEAHVRPN
jgi:ribosomal protein S18 acetylase RimI-like enzyme